jgi:lycopene beta-cyclase
MGNRMSLTNHFDIIIAGAGSAGLSLLREIQESPSLKGQQILLIDKEFNPEINKTWCFWEEPDKLVQSLIHHTWERLEVRTSGHVSRERLKEFKYHCVKSKDYLSELYTRAKEDPRVHLLESGIKGFSSEDEFGIVETDGGKFEAPLVFQSVLRNPVHDPDLGVETVLIQHFLGWEIETEQPLFDPGLATLMDFDIPQDQGFSFFYTLPFSENHALVEYTLFSGEMLSKKQYENEIRNYLSKRLNLSEKEYKIRQTEFGAIPMEGREHPDWHCPHVYNIGSAGGITKPTTGYTFIRIQKHSQEIVNAMENGKPLPEGGVSSFRFRLYDIMMLLILDKEPLKSVEIFEKLFKSSGFDRVFRFLAEETHLLQELNIFSRLPYMPFFRSIFKNRKRIVGGAKL